MGKTPRPISIYEGLKRYYAGQDVLMMVSVNGDFEGRHPVDAALYLKKLLNEKYMQFYELVEDEVGVPELIVFDDDDDMEEFKRGIDRAIKNVMGGQN